MSDLYLTLNNLSVENDTTIRLFDVNENTTGSFTTTFTWKAPISHFDGTNWADDTIVINGIETTIPDYVTIGDLIASINTLTSDTFNFETDIINNEYLIFVNVPANNTYGNIILEKFEGINYWSISGNGFAGTFEVQ